MQMLAHITITLSLKPVLNFTLYNIFTINNVHILMYTKAKKVCCLVPFSTLQTACMCVSIQHIILFMFLSCSSVMVVRSMHLYFRRKVSYVLSVIQSTYLYLSSSAINHSCIRPYQPSVSAEPP